MSIFTTSGRNIASPDGSNWPDIDTNKLKGITESRLEDTSRTLLPADELREIVMGKTNSSETVARTIRPFSITPDEIKNACIEGKLNSIFQPFDEIDIPLEGGDTRTAVCAYVCPTGARFIFQNCWERLPMAKPIKPNSERNLYANSEGREFVLKNIYPSIAKEWKELLTPRQIIEKSGGIEMSYEDPMWLVSMTDVFGEDRLELWKDCDSSFQLPIFTEKKDRVMKFGGDRCAYWTRTIEIYSVDNFFVVNGSGKHITDRRNASHGYVVGFDIGTVVAPNDKLGKENQEDFTNSDSQRKIYEEGRDELSPNFSEVRDLQEQLDKLAEECLRLKQAEAVAVADLEAAKRDIAAILWLNGNCDYCAYGRKDEYCGASRWSCALGRTVDCEPESITLPKPTSLDEACS